MLAAREALVGDRRAHASRASPAGWSRRDRAAAPASSTRSQDLGLGRQFGGDLFLGAAQHERAHALPASTARRSPSCFFSIGVRNTRRERVGVAEKPGHRGSRTATTARRDGSPSACRSGTAGGAPSSRQTHAGSSSRWRFLIVCASSSTARCQSPRQQTSCVARQQRIGGQHQIVRRRSRRSAPCAVGPVQRQHAQRGREACRLGEPVRDQAGRADDESRPVEPAGRLLDQHMRQGLHRLAQAHVVGEDAAELVAAQELQPVQPVALIGAQFRAAKSRRRFDRVDFGETCDDRGLRRAAAHSPASAAAVPPRGRPVQLPLRVRYREPVG